MAAEFVGGALLSSFLQVAFEKLLTSGQVVDYFRRRRLNETLLDKLRIKLLSLNSVLDDAEEKHITNLHVKSWLDKVKDVVLDAEDLLDEIDTEASKSKLEAEFHATTSRVWNFFSATGSSFDREIESRMTELLDNLQVLANEKDTLGLKEGSGVVVGLGKKSSQRLSTTSLVDEAVVYGRDDDKEVIIERLLSNNESDNNLSIISIVGMGGMGKTTLAQLVYNDHRMKDEFDLRAWVCVSEDFDVIKVTRTVLEAITLSTDDTKDINMLQVKLKDKLSGKKFLIVLDDLWNENYLIWEAFRTPFIYGAQGSKIIVTTRSDKVASTMRVAKLHHLKQLAAEDSWLLFAKHALRDEDHHSNTGFEEIGRKIIKKCKGLPLALKTVGSLLYTKLSHEEWNSVLRSDMWEMSDNKNSIIPVLRLSYQYLPSHLKRCFGYCSLFPKDYEFDKEHLIRLWMAENFLVCNGQNKSMKELGDQFFQDLLSRSFFQRSGGDGTRFVMHDLINDLAKHVSGEFCFRLDAEKAPHVSKLTRHFSYSRRVNEYSKRFEIIYNANRLRTFIPLSMHRGRIFRWMPSNMIHELLSKVRCLRVLSLSGYLHIYELPDSVGNLKHLRYLDLSGTRIKELPNSMCSLYNLQTLKLRHCEYLVELPSDMHKLINLHHLDFRGTKLRMLPMGLGKLKKLQVLTSFFVGKSGESNTNQLAELNLRSTLSILELQNVVHPMDALAANLKNKMHLEGLMLKWSNNDDGSQNERDVLERLQPHTNLKHLCIENYGGTRFPNWFEDNSLSNVVSLELNNCKFCFYLPALGILPSLKQLLITGLDGIVAIGTEFYGNNNSFTAPFRSLHVLKIQEMAELEEWECQNGLAGTGAFPCLKELHVRNCPKLKKQLPQQLPSLVKLAIHNCEQLAASLPRALAICDLLLKNSGNLQWESPASTLKYLEIEGLRMETSLLRIIEHTISITCLESFVVRDCPNMEFPVRHSHTFLGTVFIDGSYESLRTFPLDFFPKLQDLSLNNCSNLEGFSISDANHLSLKSLEICGCPKFISFPRKFSAPKMEFCRISRVESLKSLSEGMNILFPSLRYMELNDCPQLESFPVGGLPSNLEKLRILSCPKLTASRMKWDLHNLASLSFLDFEDDAIVESFPDQGLLPPTLASITLYWCSNLKALDYKGLCHVSSLKELRIGDCPRLQCLPKEGLPSSLSTFNIWGNCGLLKQRCQKQRGGDWSKISHIPCILIDNDIIT